MELRIYKDISAIKTPIGYIPIYEDLVKLFDRHLNKEYTETRYEKEFTLKIDRLINKIERIWNIYVNIPETPQIFFNVMSNQKKKLEEIRSKYGDKINQFKLNKV